MKKAHKAKIKMMGFGILALIAVMFVVPFIGNHVSDIPFAQILTSSGACLAIVLPAYIVNNAFVELKGEDLKTFVKEATAEELAGYYTAKNAHDKTELEKLIASKATPEDIAKAMKDLEDSRIEQMKSLNDTLKSYGLQIKKLSEADKSNYANAKTSIRKGLEENIASLKGLKDRNSAKAHEFSFEVKAAGTMLESGNISGGNVPVEQRLPGLNTIASRAIRLLDILTKGTATSNVISWVYQANKDGAAGQTAEGATKNQIDFDLVVDSQTVKKTTAFIKVSTEMLDDVDFIESEIRNELMREVLKKIEAGVYNGDGLGENLKGIRTVSTAFAAGSFANAVDNANEADVIAVAMNQITIAEQGTANYILVNPATITKLKLVKVSSTDKRYVDFQYRFQVINGQAYIDGVPMIGTTLVTAGEYLIGNFDFATLYEKESMNIQVGLDGNDFTKNLRTIIIEWRGLVIVKNNDRTAFVKGVFATDAAALETA